jgi:hypothetical protein
MMCSRTFVVCRTLLSVFAVSLMAPVQPLKAQTPVRPNPAPSPKNITLFGNISVSSPRLRPGDIVYVTLTIRNQSPTPAMSERLSPRTVYTQGENYRQKGPQTASSNPYSVVMTLSGPQGNEWPYRWGIGGTLKAMAQRRLTLPLKMTTPGLYTLYVGIAAGNTTQEFSLGQIGLEVAPRGKSFETTLGRPVGTPPPTRLLVNGKETAIDRWPLYYQEVGKQFPETYRILIPIRFVAEGMGAEVRWDAATRTAHIHRGKNRLELRAGSSEHLANGSSVTSHIPLRVVSGRTMVPLNFLTEQLGGKIEWNLRTQTLAITLPDIATSSDTN